ncbi:LlaJI family restriction endonuclease [Pantoea allii]|uniref:LlaJI family restriction endonuclease n=1 Tax=Pantoea allii TaxID=574096 RepID=UPI003D318829
MSLNNIIYLTDRMPVTDSNIPSLVMDELRKMGLISKDKHNIHFCGIISFSEGLAVFLPRNSSKTDNCNFFPAHYLFRAIFKYYNSKDTAFFAEDDGNELIGGKSLSLATSLIDDYLTNGLYVRRIRLKTTNSGKIFWPDTIARRTAYPSMRGPAYIDFSTTCSRFVADSETTKIHAFVIRELYPVYGALWTGEQRIPERSLSNITLPTGNFQVWISKLRKELQLSYSERDIFLIRSLLQYLENERGIISSKVLIGVQKFHSLWEAMLDDCLIGKYQVNNKIPIPVYKTIDGVYVPMAQKGQRTDTVLYNSDKTQAAIIDAKYYDAKNPNTAPGWPDLVKQFFYHNVISYVVPANTLISNHFIFPGCSKMLKAVYVAERDKELVSNSDCLTEYPPIHCHYQEPIELLRLYVAGEKLAELTKEIFRVYSRTTH